MIVCSNCGGTYNIGDWPFCRGNPAEHARPRGLQQWNPYWDEHIDVSGKPAYIDSWATKQRYLREHWHNGNLVKVVEREIDPKRWKTR